MRSIEEGLRALAVVQAAFPTAILAGGYLRDSMLDRDQKDIDIFVPHDPDAFKRLGGDEMTGAAEYMEQTEVDAILSLDGGFDLPAQVIMLSPGLDPVDRAKAHDFGLCQVWHDGKDWHYTQACVKDFLHRTFTLCHCEDKREYDRSMRRWERLSAKYPEFTLVIPDGMQSA